MRFFYFIFLFFFFIFIVGLLPLANASCSLGASPLAMSAEAEPGQKVEIGWNVFNLRGDRPTHVLISKSKGPDWKIDYEPQAEMKQYEVSGIVKNSTENLVIEKSEIVKEKPSGDYVVHPNSSKGYIKIKRQQKIYVSIPEDAEIGKTKDFVFTGVGKCFGQTGAISASVATELKVSITPVEEYYEKPVGTNSESIGQKFVDAISKGSKIKPAYMIMIGITLILFIVFIILVLLSMRSKKNRSKNNKNGK